MKTNNVVRSGFLLAALGLVYANIGISPLYVLKYVVMGSGGLSAISEEMVLGSLSLILWCLLLPATVKGILLLLQVDNQGEGGIFALYTLVWEQGRWLLLPAALGCAALLTGAVLTPALTLTAAVEGSYALSINTFAGPNRGAVVVMVLFLLSTLYFFQGLGSQRAGTYLGPVMLAWFLFTGITGAFQISGSSFVFRAFNPMLGMRFLFHSGNILGFALPGFVFLSMTGMEVLYANLDFAGRKSIRQAWPFVLLCLALSYLGQGAWLIRQAEVSAQGGAVAVDPFFQMLPYALRLPALFLALTAAWAASQTAVNGAFTLVSEAIRLNLLPYLEIRYPSDSTRQEFLPAVNFLMWFFGCAAVFAFRTGQRMASVYGLTMAVSMLMTTMLLFVCSRVKKPKAVPVRCLLILFGTLEACFAAASFLKLPSGGVAALFLILLLFAAMLSWNKGDEIERQLGFRLPVREYLSQLRELRSDTDFLRITDNLVYIDKGSEKATVDQAILYSILDRGPKRARAYWFVTVNVSGEPFLQNYQVETFGTDYVFRLQLDLGYKCSRPMTRYLKDALFDMERRGLAPIYRKNGCVDDESALGTFHYCVLRRRASGAEVLTMPQRWAMRMRRALQGLAGLREEWFAERNTDVETEQIPLSFPWDDPGVHIRLLPGDSERNASQEKEKMSS